MSDVQLPPKARSLIDRAKGLLLKPREEWAEIKTEVATLQGLYTGYALLMAAIPAIAIFIGLSFIGVSGYRFTIGGGISAGVGMYITSLVAVTLLGFAIEFLGPQFGAKPDRISAFKLAVYSMTPFWVAGAIYILPNLGALAGLAGLYGAYLMYIGLPILAPAEGEKAQTWSIVACIAAVLAVAIAAGAGQSTSLFGVYADNSPAVRSVAVPGYGSVDVTKAEAAAKAADAAIERALATTPAPATVQPVAAEALSALLPGEVAGFRREEVMAADTVATGVAGGEVRAAYRRGQDERFELAVTDMGGAAAFSQLAAAFDVSHTEKSGGRYEKMGRVDGRLTVEKYDPEARTGVYSVVVAERFMVEANGRNVDMTALKAAVGSVGFARLEALARG